MKSNAWKFQIVHNSAVYNRFVHNGIVHNILVHNRFVHNRLVHRGKIVEKRTKNTKISLLLEKPTVAKVTRIADELKRGTEAERKKLINGKGPEKSDERKRGTEKKNGKERAAGDENIELHFH